MEHRLCLNSLCDKAYKKIIKENKLECLSTELRVYDWTFHPCFDFQRAVNDICWSPWSSTVFASVNEGAVEVWDLAQST